MSINMDLNNIKTAVYGRDVRSAIYNCIKYAIEKKTSVEISSEEYAELVESETIDPDLIYYIYDTGEIYKNGISYGGKGGGVSNATRLYTGAVKGKVVSASVIEEA